MAAEATEDNNNERESDVAMMTVANNDCNSDSGIGGIDGGGGDSNRGKKITINLKLKAAVEEEKQRRWQRQRRRETTTTRESPIWQR